MMPNPWLILGAIAFAVSSYLYGHHSGYGEKEAEDAQEIARLNGVMNESKNQQDAKDVTTKHDFEYKLAGILAGRPRLLIPTSSPTGCAAPTSGDGQARTELDGQTAEDLIRIVADGDRAILDLNSCIDRYEAIRGIANGHH